MSQGLNEMSQRAALGGCCLAIGLIAAFAATPAPASAQTLDEVAKLLADDGASGDQFGKAVHISGDTAIVGAHGDDDNGSGSGSAYVFSNSGGTWALEQKLIASDGAPSDAFGTAVAVFGDVAFVGAPRADKADADCGAGICYDVGAVYVFTRSGGVWTEQQKLVGSNIRCVTSTGIPVGNSPENFGSSISLSGNRALVGAPRSITNLSCGLGTTTPAIFTGVAYVLEEIGGVWTETAKLQASDREAYDRFGESVALDGSTALIGNSTDDDLGSSSGSAYVFEENGGVWTEERKLLPTGGTANDFFGADVHLSGDTAMIGARRHGPNTAGAVFVHQRNGGLWNYHQKLVASDGATNDFFGTSVSADGDIALIGASRDADNGSASGSAYVFVRSGSFWFQYEKVTASDGVAGDFFGESVSVSGLTGLVGAFGDDEGGSAVGAVYVFAPGEVDTDSDGYTDDVDNCPNDANPGQEDWDLDGQGDVCDDDDDDDGELDAYDNCPLHTNPDQEDNDLDGIGDACDPDDDNDGVQDFQDNCQFAANPDQTDTDGDFVGDVCDGDIDADTVANDEDNCPNVPNGSQEDADLDGLGDACDEDDDDDGVIDADDNCITVPNSDQTDTDDDTLGDACDADDDEDTILDDDDNCPLTANEQQLDADGDGDGDACDVDDDNDGILDGDDNCQFVGNSGQANNDGDLLGDLCDPDDDNDGVLDGDDNCPLTANANQTDSEGDGMGDVCDYDDDNDTVPDTFDNCQFNYNVEQFDTDMDGLGDVCDGDIDGDGWPNENDLCPYAPDPTQADMDGDGVGDACDPDIDGDGHDNDVDSCPLIVNPDQTDSDGDGLGDVCDPDDDNDGVADGTDNCPMNPNPDQADWDGDGEGNVCDLDVDGDGVVNGDDLCEFTPDGAIIDPDTGCSIEQLAPCEGPRGSSQPWKNHGQYVAFVTKTANSFYKAGLITGEEKGAITAAAANSSCGKK